MKAVIREPNPLQNQPAWTVEVEGVIEAADRTLSSAEVWLAAYLADVRACPAVRPSFAAERADEALKLYEARFPGGRGSNP